ncbi:HEPN domain-containing protein [Streptosporangium sp. NPDC000563]|uniref:HEPN domain-containing protein n=1 Tax=Streptosporangium sp. NPDC000563 TaxID=3154366 RepID=UPI003326BD41
MAAKIDCDPLEKALRERVEVARRLVDATKLKPVPAGDVSREARGLAIVLLFAAYENLLTALCRTLLESAAKSRARGRRLKPGLQLFLAHNELSGLADGGKSRIWRSAGLELIKALNDRPAASLNMNLFPNDGSFMKSSQVKLFCEVFDLGDPGPILREVWPRINTIVDQRNAIAHGRTTPDEIGRSYSYDELIKLTRLWEERWVDFLKWVEASCQGPLVFLKSR